MSRIIVLTGGTDHNTAVAERLRSVGGAVGHPTDSVVTVIIPTSDPVVVNLIDDGEWVERFSRSEDTIGAVVLIDMVKDGYLTGAEQLLQSAGSALEHLPVAIGVSVEVSNAVAQWAASSLGRQLTDVPVYTVDPDRPHDITTILATVVCMAHETAGRT